MNKIVKKALILGSIGFVIGLIIGLTVFFITEGGKPEGVTFSAFSILEFLVGGIYGAMAMGGTVAYDIESWSIARSTATHFVITFAGFHVLAYIQGWFFPKEAWYIILVIAWIIAYIIIWLTQYLIFRKKIRKMNEDLKKMNRD